MFSVFSKKLFEFRAEVEKTDVLESWTLEETLRVLKPYLTNTTALLHVNPKSSNYEEDVVLYTIYDNDELMRIVVWINKKILQQLGKISYLTLAVRLRIATCMLNKAVENCKIDRNIGIILHDNFVKNLTNVHNDLVNESLPF